MKTMYSVVKLCLYDFQHEIKVCYVTEDKELAKSKLKAEIEKEKEIQEKGSIVYDTENETDVYYEAYNDGYEATDSVHITIEETIVD